jgi:hypothetical protein
MMFRLRGEFEQHISLTELEEMLPYERSIYFILMHNKIEKRKQDKGNKNG